MLEGFGAYGTLVEDGSRLRVRGSGVRRMNGNPTHYFTTGERSEDYVNNPGEFAGNPMHYLNVSEDSESAVNNPGEFAGFGETPSVAQDVGIGISAVGSVINTLFGTPSTSCPAGYMQDPNTKTCVPVQGSVPWVPLVGLGLAGVALFLVMKKKG